jgi:hypothetical protein
MLLVWPMPQIINLYWCQKMRTFYNCEVQEWQHTELNALKCLSSCHKKTFKTYESYFWHFLFLDVRGEKQCVKIWGMNIVSFPKWNMKLSTWEKAIKTTTRTPWWQTKRLGHLSILNLCLKLTVPMAKGKRAFDTGNFK